MNNRSATHTPRSTRHSWRAAAVCLLMLALLLAQLAGLRHRIVHARGAAPAATAQWQSGTPADHGTLHDCTLYDAATGADCLHSAAAPLPQPGNSAVAIAHPAPHSWHALLQLPFFAHAPPPSIS